MRFTDHAMERCSTGRLPTCRTAIFGAPMSAPRGSSCGTYLFGGRCLATVAEGRALIAPSPNSDDRSVDAKSFLPFVDFIWLNKIRRRGSSVKLLDQLGQLRPAIGFRMCHVFLAAQC